MLDEIEIKYPVGHKRRRAEGTPLLEAKFRRHIAPHYPEARVEELIKLTADQSKLEAMAVDKCVGLPCLIVRPARMYAQVRRFVGDQVNLPGEGVRLSRTVGAVLEHREKMCMDLVHLRSIAGPLSSPLLRVT